jgi:hypothetical protein
MYKLSVGTVFKNEGNSIKEWVEHYLHHGVEHFYLINDNSNDNYLEKIQYYLDKNIITLYNAGSNFYNYTGRQKDMYNTYILPHINNKNTEWLLMVDLDEYVWSPQNKDLNEILSQCSHFGQIQVNHTLFGSNCHITQPDSIVNCFTKRSSCIDTKEPLGNFKYFINSKFEFISLNVHHATFAIDEYHSNKNIFINLGQTYFRLNHYCCQSLNFWINTKCTRGDADNYKERKSEEFYIYDLNDVEDYDLMKQNQDLKKT